MNKILIVTEGMQDSEQVKLSSAIFTAAKKNGVEQNQIEKAFSTGQIVREKLEDKEWSTTLSVKGSEDFTHILSVGSIASNKVGIQNMKNERILLMIPNPRSWDDKMTAGTVESIAKFLKDWSVDPTAKKVKEPAFFDPPTEEEKAKAKEKKAPASVMNNPAVASQTKAIEEYDLASLEAFLKIEVSNNRLWACISNYDKDAKPTIQLVQVSVVREKPLEDFIPVLVSTEVLKDKDKMDKLVVELNKSGYKNTYLMPTHEFAQVVRLSKDLTSDRKITIELVI